MTAIVTLSLCGLLRVSAVPLPGAVSRQSGAPPSKTTADGVYSESQAGNGRTIFGHHCSECHMADLSGNESAPPLAGDTFLSSWQGHTVADLFDRIRTTMPQNAPGSLSRKEYVDLVSFLLSANDFPSGKEDLKDDEGILKSIIIKKK